MTRYKCNTMKSMYDKNNNSTNYIFEIISEVGNTYTCSVYGNEQQLKYEYDKELNGYDINDCIIDHIIKYTNYNNSADNNKLIQIIDPNYINFEMAIKLAINGYGYLISDKYSDLDGIKMLRVVGGEISDDSIDTKDVESNIVSYITDVKKTYNGIIRKEKSDYLKEEKRSLKCVYNNTLKKLEEQLNQLAETTAYKNEIHNKILRLEK